MFLLIITWGLFSIGLMPIHLALIISAYAFCKHMAKSLSEGNY